MHRRRIMAILAQQTAFGVSVPAFEFVMGVILDVKIVLGVQFAHFAACFRVGRAIGKFHRALKRDPDAFAAVVAGYAGFVRNAGVYFPVCHHFCFP